MAGFVFSGTIGVALPEGDAAPYMTGISTMSIVEIDGAQYLVVGSRAESGVTLIALAEGEIAGITDSLGPSWDRGLYGLTDLEPVTVDGQDYLLPAGTMDDAPALLRVDGTGFSSTVSYMGEGLPPQLQQVEAIETPTGTFVYYTQWGTDGLGVMALGDDLSLSPVQTIPDDDEVGLAAITALTTATIGTKNFVFAASGTENTVTSMRIGADGSLRVVDSISPDEGLWVSAPTVIEEVVAGGNTYLIVGASESSSLSVIQVVPWGGMTVTDHVVDDLTTRFDDVAAIETLKVNHRVLVFVGGSDDGITVFELAPSGHLYPIATIADTADTTLQNVTAIAATEIGDEIQVFVSGEGEAGITQFTLDLDNFGVLRRGTPEDEWLNGIWADDLLDGFEGDDVLKGNVGNDTLIDGPGKDIMFGGRGADTFVFVQDGDLDIARDFTPGEDKIDMSDFDMLYSFDQLTIEQRPYGVVVKYDGEAIRLESEYDILEVADLSPDDFIF